MKWQHLIHAFMEDGLSFLIVASYESVHFWHAARAIPHHAG